MSYKAEFFDKLLVNIKRLEDKLSVDEQGNLTRSIENTCFWADALRKTFSDVSDVAGMLGMVASCDFSPIKDKS